MCADMKVFRGKGPEAVLLAFIAICIVALLSRIYAFPELPVQILASVFGVVLTVLVTYLLLGGQSKSEEDLQKSSKVFEEKLKVYKEFLSVLYEAVKDRNLDEAEKLELQFQTSLVAMHCRSDQVQDVAKGVKNVVQSVCRVKDKANSESSGVVLESLFEVVVAFRKDLYGDSSELNAELVTKLVESFSNAYESIESEDVVRKPQRIAVDLNVVPDSVAGAVAKPAAVDTNCNENVTPGKEKTDNKLWLEAKEKWVAAGWEVQENEDSLKIRRNQNPGCIDVACENGRYYIQAQYESDRDFAKALKWEKGGARSYGVWWMYLPFDISEGSLQNYLDCDVKFQVYLTSFVDYLQDVIVKHHRTSIWKKAVGDRLGETASKGWRIFIWYWETLALESCSIAGGRVYMDISSDPDSGEVSIVLSNRENNKDKLVQLLQKTGLGSTSAISIKNGQYVFLIVLDCGPDASDKIAAEVSDLLVRISGKDLNTEES